MKGASMTTAQHQKPDFLTKPTLVGKKTILRPFSADDADAMANAINDPEVVILTGSGDPTKISRADLANWYGSRNLQDDRLDLAITDRMSGICCGEAVLNEYNATANSCNFRILIGPAGRGQGLGQEAVQLILDHAFTFLGLHRVELEVYAFNPRARHIYEKAGFRIEGIRREVIQTQEGWADAITMAILDHEWLQLKPV